ncbi:MAG: glycosyltransferase family 4 protein [Alphaproteobacteria bacterium]
MTPGNAPSAASAPGTVAVVVKGYPRLSETFVAQELHGLELGGLKLRIYSLRRPTDKARHAIHDEIAAPIAYLPEYLHDAPARVWRAWRRARKLPGYQRAWRAWRRDLARDFTRNRIRRFGQALVLADELAPDVTHLYAHFIHTPASVARYTALLTGLKWSVSAHAKDIWTTPKWDLAGKLDDADWAVTCTRTGRDYLAELAADQRKIELIYHGLDVARFPVPTAFRAARDGLQADQPVRILSVGRAVAKKGFDVLLDALAQLPKEVSWRFVHIGGGDRQALHAFAARNNIADRIEWRGALPQDQVLAAYRTADIFVLASRITADGDRDGMPNVLMEAMSQGLPCLSTRISGIVELIEHDKTGWLVAPDDATALADALHRLIVAPALRRRLAEAGSEHVRRHFNHQAGLATLLAKFQTAPARHA